MPSIGCASASGWPQGERAINNVVMMGMGEPLQNYAALVPALRTMLDDHGYGLSRRRVTVSTSGVVPMIDRLRDDCPVALAVSLHAPERRVARRAGAAEPQVPDRRAAGGLPSATSSARRATSSPSSTACSTASTTRRDQADELLALVAAAGRAGARLPCKFNLIPFNPFPASGLKRSPRERVGAFARCCRTPAS